ncbi:hypothetical protein CPB84DRAFT_1769111 [Gymnopilus junonius]|uniref:Uncharacterized protein n=1 Tax=Gymnopilus junonius TaxID=109634 RepID=A0A9P5NRY9_GYMJU|nr:hypothetical protein CPB84DRAFT_1769091 [Gymnopilus junonius]KAF8906978.1 hypothetical protein CPB84DRAFT_1769111 [Gymnopilus junonius]
MAQSKSFLFLPYVLFFSFARNLTIARYLSQWGSSTFSLGAERPVSLCAPLLSGPGLGLGASVYCSDRYGPQVSKSTFFLFLVSNCNYVLGYQSYFLCLINSMLRFARASFISILISPRYKKLTSEVAC